MCVRVCGGSYVMVIVERLKSTTDVKLRSQLKCHYNQEVSLFASFGRERRDAPMMCVCTFRLWVVSDSQLGRYNLLQFAASERVSYDCVG